MSDAKKSWYVNNSKFRESKAMFKFENLDDTTRAAMLEAIEEAERSDNIYSSARFNASGNEQWLPLLKETA
jgi:hypothetical protein